MTMLLRMKVTFIAIGVSLTAAITPAIAAEPYKINVILPLTGGASFAGKGEKEALEVFQATINKDGGINGAPLQFVFHDDQSNPQVTVQLASDIVANKPAIMLGSAIVAMCKAIAPMLNDGPFNYCLSPGVHPKEGDYQFSTSASTRALLEVLVRYLRLTGSRKIAFMTSTDASGQDADEGLNDVLKMPENASVHVVERRYFNPKDVSVSAQVERIKSANPQVLIAWSTGAPIGTVFKALIQAGADFPVATTNGNQTYAQMAQYKDFLPKQLYIPTSIFIRHEGMFKLQPEVEEQQRRFYAAFAAANQRPDNMAALAWDPALLVVSALSALGPNATAKQVREYLAGQTNFAGINGIYDFKAAPQRGLTVSNALVSKWDPAAETWVPVSGPSGITLRN
jgi:branched-chain amino acid transport system substrate-binding protein